MWDDVIIICSSCDVSVPLDADDRTFLAAQLLTFLAAHWECAPLQITMQVAGAQQRTKGTA